MMSAVTMLLVLVLVLHVKAATPVYEDEGFCIASKMESFGCSLDLMNRDMTCINNYFYFYFDDCGKKCHQDCSDHPDRNSRCEEDLSGCSMVRESKCDADCGRGVFVVKYICSTTSGASEDILCPTFCCCRHCSLGTPGSFPPYQDCRELAGNLHHDIACIPRCCPEDMTAYPDIPGYCFSGPSRGKKNFAKATVKCGTIHSGSYQGYLMEPRSAARHNLVRKQGVQLWFGAKRDAQGAGNDLMWQHSGGSAEADLASWWHDPNTTGAICLNTHFNFISEPKYADKDCDALRKFVCEIEALC